MARAVASFRHGKFRDAEDLLRPILAASPRDHAALHLLGVIKRERGDNAQAIELLRQAVSLNGKIASYHGNLGHAYLMSEQFDDAAASYRRVLDLEPSLHLARFGLGMARLGQKNFAAATSELRKFVTAVPSHVDGHANLGTALSELGRHDEALSHLQRALAMKPNHANLRFKYGMALQAKGDLSASARQLTHAIELDPKLPDAYFQLGLVMLKLDRLDQGVAALREAVRCRPNLVAALYELGRSLNRMQLYDEASQNLEQGLSYHPNSAILYIGLARTRHLQGRLTDARSLVHQAMACGLDEADGHNMLGLVYQSEGRFEDALAEFERAVAVRPDHAAAQLGLAMLHKTKSPEDRIGNLEAIRRLGPNDVDQRATLSFALAKEYEKQSDYEKAFAEYQTANDLRRIQYPLGAENYESNLERFRVAFNPELMAAKANIGSQSERPVFVVGMMRSGTTLIEQILASHPHVYGHGELDHIRQIVQTLPREIPGLYPDDIRALKPETAQRLADVYLARLNEAPPGALRSIDKLPHNFEHLGVISLLFPKARIIYCTRDPADTCLSSYFHDFEGQNRFTYSLDTIGRYYRYLERLMAHWESVLPNPILRMPYEELVANQEEWSRRAVEFLGLPWDDRCLAFHENERPVYTYSLWQVRQPIYRNSIQRWRPYARHLGPLFDALGLPQETWNTIVSTQTANDA